MKEGTDRKKRLSKYRIEILKEEGEICEFDELNNELCLSMDQYKNLKALLPEVVASKARF